MEKENRLIKFWKSNPEEIEAMSIKELINIASGSEEERCKDLREFLQKNEENDVLLERLVNETLNNSIKHEKLDISGFILQELINEIGRRLEFKVEYGVYRGTKNPETIGYDGVWITEDGYSFIIESKKTDTYNFELETAYNYREQLIENKKVDKEKSSILIVLGKEKYKSIEYQIRGSEFLWNTRAVEVNALLKLLKTKKELNDKNTLRQMYEILKPHEYSKVDKLIDLIFFTANDSKLEETEEEDIEKESSHVMEKTEQERKKDGIKRLEEKLNMTLNKKMKSLYVTEDNQTGIITCVSHKYTQGQKEYYWFAYKEYYQENLKDYKNGYIAYICEGREDILLLPIEKMEEFKKSLNRSQRGHWHIQIYLDENKIKLRLKGKNNFKDITEYKV